jgi:TPR repeat protein
MKRLILILLLGVHISRASDHTKEAPSPEVLKNIQDAAKEGKPQSEFELGCLMSSGEYLPKNSSEAFKLFLASAQQGYAKAQYKVGVAYFNGEGVAKDQKEGLAWMYLSSMDGLPTSLVETMETTAGSELCGSAKKRSQALLMSMPKEVIRFCRLKEMAPDGNPETQYQLGLCYKSRKIEPMNLGEAVLQMGGVGNVSANDMKEAVRWIRTAAQQGYAPAQNELANLYEINRVDNLDDRARANIADVKGRKNAIYWWAKAAAQGYAPAENNLGAAIKEGWAASVRLEEEARSGKNQPLEEMDAAQDKDKKDAALLFQKAANQGYSLAQNNLGDCYMKGEGVEKNPIEAVRWYTAAANQGNIFAQSSLGDAYANGIGVEKSIPNAIKWYENAGALGDNKANRKLGNLYSRGDGVPKDPHKAVEYWEKAAGIGGDEVAMRHLGDAYFDGNGVEKDLQKALEWHHRSGNLGDPQGAVSTGDAHLNGWGTPKSVEEAMDWYESAAVNYEENIYPPALIKLTQMGEWGANLVLGHAYINSRSKKGVEFMKKAAAFGSVDAEVELAFQYFYGGRLTKDQIEGLAWMNLAGSAESNKQPSSKDKKISRGIAYQRALNSWVQSGILYFSNGDISNDDKNNWEKNPDFLISIAHHIASEWDVKLGQDGSLKAQQRAKELQSELTLLKQN